jgi:hypothetical protein
MTEQHERRQSDFCSKECHDASITTAAKMEAFISQYNYDREESKKRRGEELAEARIFRESTIGKIDSISVRLENLEDIPKFTKFSWKVLAVIGSAGFSIWQFRKGIGRFILWMIRG